MIKLFIILIIASFALANPYNVKRKDEVKVQLSHGGYLLGELKSLNLREKYASFRGIPYALPPVKDLRLRPPVTHPGWEGNRNATSHGGACLSPGYLRPGSVEGQEDCLYLNVYSPEITSDKKYPVMFWIHGGAYTAGSSDSLVYGPEWLVKEGVVVVTINYRLGLLGFFSTGDKNSPGNYGAKDIIEGLKWVQNNIEAFNGDKNSVTVFGESAGGALTHYVVLSKMSKGLFHRAISQSGTTLNPWAFQEYPKTKAFEIAKKMNLTATTTEEIVKQIREIEDLKQITSVIPTLLTLPVPRGNVEPDFAPVVETEDAPEPRFLEESPLTIMKKGTFNDVPYILGFNSQEALFSVREVDFDSTILEQFNNNTNWLIPYEWHITPNTEAADDIIMNIKDKYFKGGPIKEKLDYVTFNSDRLFAYPTYKTVELHAAKQKSPVYYYLFSFDGIMNYIKKLILVLSYEGAMHADEIGYLWRVLHAPAPALPGSKSDITKQRMVQMWTNFAKYGNPTPEVSELITTLWTQVKGNQEYLDIGENLVENKQPFADRFAMWKNLDEKYN